MTGARPENRAEQGNPLRRQLRSLRRAPLCPRLYPLRLCHAGTVTRPALCRQAGTTRPELGTSSRLPAMASAVF